MGTTLLRLQITALTFLHIFGARIRRAARLERSRACAGQAFLEYALVIAVVAVIVLVAVQAFGADLTAVFDRIRKRLSTLG